MRSGEESPWWCPPATHGVAGSPMSLQPLDAHVRRWQRVRHHETDHHPRIPQLQLHKLPQVLTNARAVKHKQDDMIKTTWLPVNIEQKLLQYF